MTRNNATFGGRRRFIKTASTAGAIGIAGLAGCVGNGAGPDEDVLRLGVLEPFTGDFAELAEERNQGEELGIQHVNESDEYDFEIEHEEYDTQLNAEDGVEVATEAIESFGADFLTGAISSSVALAINEIAARDRVVYTPGAADVSITGENCNEWVFRFETHTAQIAEAMTDFIAAELGNRVAYLSADYAYGQSVNEEVHRLMSQKADDYERVDEFWPQAGAGDHDAFITSAQDISDETDALVIGMTGSQLIRFLSQADDRGLNDDVPIVTTTGSFRVVRAGAGAATNDVYSGVRYIPGIETGDNQQFVEDYINEYGTPPDNFSRVGFESVRMIANGAQRAGSTQAAEVQSVLPGMTHDTIFGEIEFRECDQHATNPVWMGQMTPGDEFPDVRLIEEYSREAGNADPDCSVMNCEL